MPHILIVDDEPAICWALGRALTEEGFHVETSSNAEDAFRSLRRQRPDVVLLDVRLPGEDGLTALPRLRQELGTTPLVVMTAFGNLETAVRAVQGGAFEYLTKPFDLETAIEVVRRALAARQVDRLAAFVEADAALAEHGLLGESPAMQVVFRQIALVAQHDVPVLICGESGVGKELVADAVHRYSQRHTGPLVPICVPAMSESVLESELFGHARGAFTGALAEREGLLTAAHGGTAFFDEIGEISLPLQVKLLRVLETKTITPVGANRASASDFRLIAATNRPLEEMVRAGTFREDLYYRLNVFRIEVPPLRERPEDISLLARHFLRRASPQRALEFSAAAMEDLKTREWPGNVRELRNVIERSVVLTRGHTIECDALPRLTRVLSEAEPAQSLASAVRQWWIAHYSTGMADPIAVGLYDQFLSEIEPVLLREALSAVHNHRGEAARILGIHRHTLRDKLRRHGLGGCDEESAIEEKSG